MRRTDDHGFALLIVLWTVVLLTLLATQLTFAGRVEVRLAGNIRSAAMAETAADGAVQAAIFHLIDPATRWPADGKERPLRVPGASVTLVIENEGGKLNPNLVEPPLMSALLRQIGLDAVKADSLADAIADWHALSEQMRPHGANAAQYRAAGLDYGPTHAPFRSVAELGAVLGMTPDILARLEPDVSVLTDTDVDPAVAPPAVRAAMATVLGAPGPGGVPLPPRLVTVTAHAVSETGGQFTRRATIRLGLTPKEPVYQVLTWQAG